MDTQIVTTKDGSHTLFVPELDEHYHSTNGAVQESLHVFIGHGLSSCEKKDIAIFEVGFGTGLNAILSYQYAKQNDLSLRYHSIEKFPVDANMIEQLNYNDFLDSQQENVFTNMHKAEWDNEIGITSNFTLKKIVGEVQGFETETKFDIVYFDAFAPSKQEEMWTNEIFQTMYDLLLPNGILVTYSSKGDVKRALKAAGFTIKKVPGPPGKREMLKAFKL